MTISVAPSTHVLHYHNELSWFAANNFSWNNKISSPSQTRRKKKLLYATGRALRTNRLQPSILFKSPFRYTRRPWIKPSAHKQAPVALVGQKWGPVPKQPQHSPAVTIMQWRISNWTATHAPRLMEMSCWMGQMQIDFHGPLPPPRFFPKKKKTGDGWSARPPTPRWQVEHLTHWTKPAKVMESERVSGDLISQRGSPGVNK